MRESPSFLALTQLASSLFLRARSLWWYALPAGFLLTLGNVQGSPIPTFPIDQNQSLREILQHLPSSFWKSLLLLFFSQLFLYALRGPFLVNIERLLLSQKHSPYKVKSSFHRSFLVGFYYELGYWIFFLFVSFISFLPLFISWQYNQSAFSFIAECAILLIFSVGMYLYFLKEFSYLYSLLTHAPTRSAFDLGFRLFRRNIFLTILFFLYLSLFSLILSFCISLLFSGISQTKAFFWITAPFFGMIFLFGQVLFLLFFHSLATFRPKKKEVTLASSKETQETIHPSANT